MYQLKPEKLSSFLRASKTDIFAVIILIAVVLFGYHGLFFGKNFFLYEDPITVSGYSYGNTLGNGWRPDKGLGISFFFGDPGVWHPWSIATLWERIVHSRMLAYNSLVLFFGILSAITLYFFLKYIVPELGMITCPLSLLIIFCPMQLVYQYQRQHISLLIGVPLFLMLLYDFYKRPKVLHLFLAALLFWYVTFFGAIFNLTQLLSLGCFFSIFYYAYFKANREKFIRKFLSIFSFGAAVTVLLGFWTFFSYLFEFSAVGYFREKVATLPKSLFLFPDLSAIIACFQAFFQAELWPITISLPGLPLLQPGAHTFNVSIVFPLVFVFFIFRRAENFWEYVFKWLIVIIFCHWILQNFFPAYNSFICYLGMRSLTILSMYFFEGSFFPLQIALIAIFIAKIKSGDIQFKDVWGRRIQAGIAFLFLTCFLGLLAFSIFSLFLPSVLPEMIASLIKKICPQMLSGYSKEFLAYVIPFNIIRLQKAMHWYSVLYYLSSVVLIVPFTREKWYLRLPKVSKVFIVNLLLLNAIFFSWTVYPLNKKKLLFEQSAHALPNFKPTDRFYRVGITYRDLPGAKTIEVFKKNWVDVEGGGEREYEVGLNETPGFNLSAIKSFTQKNVADFLHHIFNGDGTKRITSLRELSAGPLISSELLDMSAVNYYYSVYEIPQLPKNLSLYFKRKHLYIYKNLSAWPYFYLAKRLAKIKDGQHLKNVQQGTAYLAEKDYFDLSKDAGTSNIEMKEFSYGRMVFSYDGDKEEFLVVADAWHPFWKAMVKGQELKVVKANEIFKGVALPPGKYTMTLFFDTSAFFPGIYVSIIAWILFLLGLFFSWKHKWDLAILYSNS